MVVAGYRASAMVRQYHRAGSYCGRKIVGKGTPKSPLFDNFLLLARNNSLPTNSKRAALAA